jgi:hypothetical protein
VAAKRQKRREEWRKLLVSEAWSFRPSSSLKSPRQ